MRFEGELVSWNDDRGFGFIHCARVGKDVFMHVSAFPPRLGRPVVGQKLSFHMVREAGGKLRASEVQLAGSGRPSEIRRPIPAPPAKKSSFAAIGLLAALYFWIELAWGVPAIFPVLYAAVSAVAFLAYAIDKRAAQRGGWRIQESTLHIFALAGGWPGAILAQIYLRHKSQKPSFRLVFWLTVLINTGLFFHLSSPYCAPGLRQLVDLFSSAVTGRPANPGPEHPPSGAP